MTDEERKKLCHWLRRGSVGWSGNQVIEPKMSQAADEIERLADERDQFAEQIAIRSETGMAKDMQEIMRINNELSERLILAQSDAEPVAWLFSSSDGKRIGATIFSEDAEHNRKCGVTTEPLYTVSPRPDASAGLIEAAELLESEARIELAINRRCELNRAASFLRSRANPPQSDPLPREHQDPSKWPTRETVERAHRTIRRGFSHD